MRPESRSADAARLWHLLTALLIAVCVVVQLTQTIQGKVVLVDENGRALASMPTRIVRYFTYFTIQSNLLSMVTAISLALMPDRDGRLWRVLRVAAVVGMTVTFVVYLVALAPHLDLHGVAYWTDLGFHIAAPLLTLFGWLVFGPWPRFDTRSVAIFVAWPVCWLLYVLILGAATGWYPYPFIDADVHGYARVAVNCLLVAALLVGLAYGVSVVDRLRTARLGSDRV
jgi:hypothetical protein